MLFASILTQIGTTLMLAAVCFLPALSGYGQSADTSSENLIHPGDLIEIDELGGSDYDWRGRLNPEGYLDGFTKIPEPIFARCKTRSELADALRETLAKTLRDPRVVVRILDRSQRPVAIFDGAVRQPMRLQIRRQVKISELAVFTGGFTDRASGEITVLRPPNLSCETKSETAELMTIRVSDILEGREGADLTIRTGDIVTVKVVEPVYVIGGVNNPGRIDWREGATVSRVVAAAGGVSGRGVTGRVSIFRRETDGSRVIDVDLDKIRDGAPDVEIKPRDIVDVPLRGDPRRTVAPTVETPEVARQQTLPLRIID